MNVSISNQACCRGLISLSVQSQLSNNKANQLDTFFVRDAHKKWSSYLRRYSFELF